MLFDTNINAYFSKRRPQVIVKYFSKMWKPSLQILKLHSDQAKESSLASFFSSTCNLRNILQIHFQYYFLAIKHIC